MKKFKQALTALVLICGAIIIDGCPGPYTDPVLTYNIAQDADIINGRIEVDVKSAAQGDTVKITVFPNSGYEAAEVRVRDYLNHPESVTRGESNTWTFKMPASNVTINATFLSEVEMLERSAGGLTLSSTWEEFNYVNALIKRVHGTHRNALDSNTETKLAFAIGKLAGPYNDPDNPAAGRQNGQFENVGLVLEKIREEDMTKWVAGPLAHSPESRNVWDTTDYTNPDATDYKNPAHIMRNVTRIYYVKSQITGVHPAVQARGGWEIERISECNVDGHAGAMHVKLVYRVGTDSNDAVRYNLLLYQSAHYNVTYDSTAIGDIYISAFDPSKKREIKHNAINETMGKSEWACDVGGSDDSYLSPNEVNMYTVIYTKESNIVITVTTTGANSRLVDAHIPSAGIVLPVPPLVHLPWDPEITPFENLSGAKFYPASAVYNVKVSRKPAQTPQ